MTPFDLDPAAPDAEEARRLAEQELQNPRYAAAKPTWFDRLAEDVADFIASLFSAETGQSAGGFALVIMIIVLVAALVTVLILWGRPRRSQRMRRGVTDLLGERDDRSAAQLRADAERAAQREDWDAATVLRFRGLARGLIERDVIDPSPGATAQSLARESARAFEGHRDALTAAAGAFDDVRYLRRPASAESYQELARTDELLMSAPLPVSPGEAVSA
ncbi:DUF4129 domain-containing protein [Microbacterium sp. GXF6406]